jgi:hypothetical protein
MSHFQQLFAFWVVILFVFAFVFFLNFIFVIVSLPCRFSSLRLQQHPLRERYDAMIEMNCMDTDVLTAHDSKRRASRSTWMMKCCMVVLFCKICLIVRFLCDCDVLTQHTKGLSLRLLL